MSCNQTAYHPVSLGGMCWVREGKTHLFNRESSDSLVRYVVLYPVEEVQEEVLVQGFLHWCKVLPQSLGCEFNKGPILMQ